jgi:sialic acid synthase SpsE
LFTKSIVAGVDLECGTVLTREHLKLKKPGIGLAASHLPELVGKKLRRDVKRDEMLSISDVDDQPVETISAKGT